MNVRDYIKSLSPDAKREYAEACGTTVEYLAQISGGHSRPGHNLAKRLAQHSDGNVGLHEIRPDIWKAA